MMHYVMGAVMVLATLTGAAKEPAAKNAAPKAAEAKAEAPAGAGMGAYSSVALEHADRAEFTLDGKLVSMSGGVRIILTPSDPATPPAPIQAEKVSASYKEGSKTPSHLLLEGKVFIDHPQGTVHAQKADWDFDKNVLTFTGSPTMDSPAAQGVEAERIVFSFASNSLVLEGRARMKNVQLSAAAAASSGATTPPPASAPLLQAGDIKDWPAFIAKLKQQASDSAASPGRQIASLLDAKVQRAIASATPEQVTEQKDSVLKQLNKAISSPKLYSETAWKGITLDEETSALLKKEGRAPAETIRMNRLLLSAAYPDLVAKPVKE